jgi:hypothetical protein
MAINVTDGQAASRAKLRFAPPPSAVRTLAPKPDVPSENTPEIFDQSQDFVELKVGLHQRLLEMINLSAIEKVEPEEFRSEASELVKELLVQEQIPLNSTERSRLVNSSSTPIAAYSWSERGESSERRSSSRMTGTFFGSSTRSSRGSAGASTNRARWSMPVFRTDRGSMR